MKQSASVDTQSSKYNYVESSFCHQRECRQSPDVAGQSTTEGKAKDGVEVPKDNRVLLESCMWLIRSVDKNFVIHAKPIHHEGRSTHKGCNCYTKHTQRCSHSRMRAVIRRQYRLLPPLVVLRPASLLGWE